MVRFYQVLFVTFICVCIVSCSKQYKHNPNFSSLGVEMVAHKGVHFDSIAPPNSLDAILLASRAGFKTIEIDLNRTKDDEIILLHDNHLHETFRLTDGYQQIDIKDSVSYCFDWTLKEMKKKFVFDSPNPEMRRFVLTFEEALHEIKKLNLFPYLEFKQMSFEDRLDVVYNAIDKAEKILGKNNFIVTCWGIYVCENIRKRYPDLVVCCDPVQDYDILSKNNFSYFPYWEEIDKDTVEKQHQEGYTISTWTVDKTALDSILAYNVDKILTDNIAPKFDKAKAIYENHSDGEFSHYTNEGELNNNIVLLKKGESIYLDSIERFVPLYFGAIHFSTEIKGKFVIEATDFFIERENQDEDFKLYSFQYMLYKKEPSFKITALDDTEIKSIWIALSKY